jgi:hypothetical protein
VTLALALVLLFQAPAGLAGRWEMDPYDSDDPGPMMEHFGVPRAFKVMATMKFVLNVTLGKKSFTLRGEGAMGDRSETFQLDGKTPTKAQVFGNKVEFVSAVENGTIVSRGTVKRDGKKEPVVWERSVDGDVMKMKLTVGERTLTRVFRRIGAMPPER